MQWVSATVTVNVLKHTASCEQTSPTSYDNRTPHDSKHPSRGGAEGKRTRYDLGLGGSSRTIRATGRIIKSGVERKTVRMMIPFSGGEAPNLFLTPFSWGRGGLWVNG